MRSYKTVLVCGSRDYSDFDFILSKLKSLDRNEYCILAHGGASGADTLAGLANMHLTRPFELIIFPAAWKVYGNSAGPIRNQRMLEIAKPDLVLAFSSKAVLTTGTRDMVERASGAGVRIRTYLTEK